jgi:hypothetical protein
MADEIKAPGGWTLKKEISLGDLIAFTSAAIAVIYAYSTLDSRVKVLEDNRASQQRTDQRQDEEHIRYQVRIDTTLSQINAKLDRLVERR